MMTSEKARGIFERCLQEEVSSRVALRIAKGKEPANRLAEHQALARVNDRHEMTDRALHDLIAALVDEDLEGAESW
jgi:hypothetical protein